MDGIRIAVGITFPRDFGLPGVTETTGVATGVTEGAELGVFAGVKVSVGVGVLGPHAVSTPTNAASPARTRILMF